MTDTASLFRQAWDLNLQERGAHSPSFSVEDYTATGRASAQYGGKRNLQWWMDNGGSLVDSWIKWRQENQGWEIWETPDGRLAIELELRVILPGDIVVKMFIDRVFVLPSGLLAPVDIKTGRTPETAEQLGVYATGLELTYGEEFRPQWGYYWDAAKGSHGQPHSLDMYTPDYLSALYQDAIRGINAGSFLPAPANNCKSWCGVSRFCKAVNGSEAEGVDPLTLVRT